MSASTWAPGTAISANNSIQREAFVASAGQTDFTITNFAYEVGSGSLYVFVAGSIQRPAVDYTELNSTSFRLTTGAPEGAIILALGFVEVTGTIDAATLRADLASSAGSTLVNFLQFGTGAVSQTVQAKLRNIQLDPQDFGAIADGTTYVSAAINLAIAAKTGSGGAINIPSSADAYLLDTVLTLPSTIALRGEGHASTSIALKNNANVDMLQTTGFSSLTGTGVTLVADGVPYSFGLIGLQFDGNKANQTSGDGIKIYGKQYIVDDLLIRDVYGVGFYSECGNDGGATNTTWKDMPESTIRNLYIDSSGSHNFQFRGKQDSFIDNIYSRLAGGDGLRFEISGATYSGLCDIGFVHSYGNTLNGFYTGVKIKAEHIEAESNYQHGIHITSAPSNCQIGLLELFGNDIGNSSTYWNGLIEAQEAVIGNAMVLDNKNSAGGLKLTGASSRISDCNIKQTGNANASAIGAEIDAASISFKGRISNYSTAGQTGLRTSNGASRSYLNIDASIENCAVGWNNVNATLGGSYKVRIVTANKDHLLFTGAGPGTYDPGSGASFRAREFWDVIAINTGTSHSGTAAAGGAGTITLAAAASAVDDVYNGCICTITAGTGIGAVGVVTDYVGATKVATVQAVNGTVFTTDGTSVYTMSTLTLASKTKGTGTIANGTTSIRLPHGLLITSITPSARNISIRSSNTLGVATRLYVSAVDKTTFTVTADANPGVTTATFGWDASLD